MIRIQERTSTQYEHFNQHRISTYLSKDEQKEILPIALAEIKNSIDRLEACYGSRHLSAIQDIAHHLAGTTSQMGLDEMTKMARSLENIPEFKPDLVSSYILELKLEAQLVKKLIAGYLKSA